MKRGILLTISSIAVVSFHCVSAYAETPTDDNLLAAIRSTSAVPGYKLVARASGKEALISTYRPIEANISDCKIDAALIAKALLVDNDFGITRCRVHFHEPTGTSSVFQEVVVTLAEIKGYTGGLVTKEQFLDSIDVQKLEEPKAQPTAAAIKQTPKSTEGETPNAAAGEPKAATSVHTTAPKTHFTSKRIGISFDVPQGWSMTESSSGSMVLKLHSRQTKQANIELEYVGGDGFNSAQERFLNTKGNFRYPGVTFYRSFERTNFGIGPYPGSLAVFRYPCESDRARPYYEMHLYFGDYKLRGWCESSAYNVVAPAFDEMVKTLAFPTRSAAAKRK